ncbi:MAG: response regulator [Tangfeifania sp.]
MIIALILLLVLLIVGISYSSIRISRSISSPVKILLGNFKEIADRNLKSSVKIDAQNEFGELSKAFMEIQSGLQEVIAYSKKVAMGDYSARMEPKSGKDELTPALNKMTQKLEEAKIKTEKENWLQKGVSGLDDRMRGNFSVRELSDRIITYLSHFLEVEMGAVYVFDDIPGYLELTGSIGLNTSEIAKIVNPDEGGLIWKAARHNFLQVVDTKDKFRKINSATGEIIPEKIYFLPMQYNNRVQAVIELAPVNEFSEAKLEFLEMIKERISINFNASVARFRSEELLKETMKQAEVLKEREDELRNKLSENQRIQKELNRETALLDSMLKTLPDYIYFKDTESKFIRISESMAGLFNVKSAKEIIGKSDYDFHPKDKARMYYEEEQKIIRKGKGFVDVIRQGVDENGEELWSSTTKLPMFDSTGKCIGTFGITKDITEIKQLEIEVNKRNEELRAQQEELKTTNEELKSQEEELRVANEELAEQTKVLTENEKNLQIQQEELRVTNEELESKTEQLEQQKKDITQKNENLLKIQNELRQKAEELARASQYKSEFLANMSHELRTPLNSLLILSKLLAENKKNNLTEDQLKSARIIYKSGKDLLELINEILDLSKIESGKMQYEFSDVPTEEIVTEISHNFKPVAKNKGLSLEIKRSEKFPEKLYTDKQRLMQIVKNLLSNAFKFTSSGTVKVKFGLPDTDTSFRRNNLNSENTCFISVEDSGVGIPKNKLEAIFEAFQQADGSISRKYGGTGLGLSISKQLSHVLGGEIHVRSTEGVGSVFTIYLPLKKEMADLQNATEHDKEAIKKITETAGEQKEKKTQPEVKTETPETSKKKPEDDEEEIPLFIEDDRDNQQNRLMVLIIHDDKEKTGKLITLSHKKNFSAVAASNINYGIKLAEKYAPQAIILSAELSDSDELKDLQQNPATKQLPVHVVSRVEESVLEGIEELKTPESEDFNEVSKNLERKISKEYKQVLVVEDDESTREAIQLLFENKDIIIHEAKTAQQAYDLISTKPFDCIILDLGLPDYSGSELLKKLKDNSIPIPNVIIHTARELSQQELKALQKYSDSIVIKGVKSDDRLMDEVTLFLHQVENRAPRTYTVSGDEDDTSGFKGKKVLVVDDDIRNVFALAQILEERDIEVFEAENGKAAIGVLKDNPNIDLVLMDIMMPVMNGYEAMQEIRKIPALENIPIITLTAKAMKEDYQKAIDSGANDYISKPVDVEKLLSLLKIWLFK